MLMMILKSIKENKKLKILTEKVERFKLAIPARMYQGKKLF